MHSMFYNARAFNQDITGWDVAGTQYFQRMFQNARAFNQDLSPWVSKFRTNLNGEYMFQGANFDASNKCKFYNSYNNFSPSSWTGSMNYLGIDTWGDSC